MGIFKPPGGSITWIAILYLFGGIIILYWYFKLAAIASGKAAAQSLLNYFFMAGLTILIVGMGLWKRQGWARWIAFGLSMLGMLGVGFTLYMKGWNWNSAWKLFGLMIKALELWKWDVHKDSPEPKRFGPSP